MTADTSTVENSMTGRVCLVTGGSSGIGKETALGLAHLGATVVVVSRNRERTEAAVEDIRQHSENPNVEAIIADLSSIEETRRVADEFLASGRPLHVLLNNAGVIRTSREVTVDGLEMTFALNHLSPYLLTNLLLDRIKDSAPARIITVSSLAHSRASLDFDDLQNERKYGAFRVYGQSKLANVLFTYELARRLQGTAVTANCLHPGLVRTGLGGGNKGLYGRIMGLWPKLTVGPLALNSAGGARTSIYLATASEVAGVSGEYFAKSKVVKSSDASRDESAARRLWEASAALTGVPI